MKNQKNSPAAATTSAPATPVAEATPATPNSPQAPKFKVTVESDYEVGPDRAEYDKDLREWLTEFLNNSDTQRKLVDKAARRVKQENRRETQLEKLKARIAKLMKEPEPTTPPTA